MAWRNTASGNRRKYRLDYLLKAVAVVPIVAILVCSLGADLIAERVGCDSCELLAVVAPVAAFYMLAHQTVTHWTRILAKTGWVGPLAFEAIGAGLVAAFGLTVWSAWAGAHGAADLFVAAVSVGWNLSVTVLLRFAGKSDDPDARRAVEHLVRELLAFFAVVWVMSCAAAGVGVFAYPDAVTAALALAVFVMNAFYVTEMFRGEFGSS